MNLSVSNYTRRFEHIEENDLPTELLPAPTELFLASDVQSTMLDSARPPSLQQPPLEMIRAVLSMPLEK